MLSFRQWRSAFTRFSFLAAIALNAGCGGEEGPALVSVTGIVTVDGTPISGAGISFRGETKPGQPEYLPGGSTDSTGKYTLITAGKDGAEVGTYKILVFPPSSPPGAAGPEVAPPTFNKKYLTIESTDLTVQVTADAAPGSYDLKLTK